MNTFTKALTTSALMFAIAGPASAIVAPNAAQDIRSAAGHSSEINVRVNGDTVTLSGHVTDGLAIQKIEQAALANGADQVNNYVRLLPR